VHGEGTLPVLVYLPGLHGDWTLVTSFRENATEHCCFVEFTYPRTTEWVLGDYAEAITKKLEQAGLSRGWLLAESFSSQIAWELLKIPRSFRVEGIILAGGFVRHPCIPLARVGGWLLKILPAWFWKIGFAVYALYAGFRHRHAPETRSTIKEFIARRTPEDLRAMRARIKLIERNDPGATVERVAVPVYALAGFFDPIVFSRPVRQWLGKECPGFAGAKVIFGADHTVLATAPKSALAQILEWMSSERSHDI
jgi:pimeloyl-ACP methyl ester carboxylesterase